MLLAQSEDDKKKQFEQQNNTFGEQSIGGGGGAQVQSSTGASQPSTSRLSPTTQSTPQNFGTIQDYFKGSREQGERFGEQFTGKLGETQQQQRGEIGQAATGATQDIQAGITGFDQDLISRASTDPTKVAGDESQFQDFLSQWNAQYSGPQSFEGSTQYGQAAKAAQGAQTKATQLESTGGRQQLIQDEFGVYGQGKKGLDEALLQQSSYFPKVQEQAKGFSTIQDYLKQQGEEVGTAASAAKATTEQTRASARAPFENRLTDFQKRISEKVAAQTGIAQSKLEQYQKNLASGDVDKVAADLKEAGVPEDEAKTIIDSLSALQTNYQINPTVGSSYISNPNIDVNPATAASREDFNRAAALQKLTGRSYAGVLNPADIEKAGTASAPSIRSTELSSYLKQSLEQRDKSTMASQPNLEKFLPDSKNIKQGNMIAQRYIDAATRQGVKPATVQELPKSIQTLLQQVETRRNPAWRAAALAMISSGDMSGAPNWDSRLEQRPEMQAVKGATAIRNTINKWIRSSK